MSKNELFERRKHKRVKLESLTKHREVLTDDFINDNRRQAQSRAADISMGGMQIITDTAWAETGDRLVEIEMDLMQKAVKVVAHVVWFMYDSRIKKYRSGVEFIVIKNQDLEVIADLV
jgi:c-di-GMP-binding flagellar brake protein YcgR